jgi:hypothetical protein
LKDPDWLWASLIVLLNVHPAYS